jgi:YbbR domain-containing protein
VAAALILFVFHRMSTLESRFFSVPLRVETSAEFMPVNAYPRLVRVTLRGDPNSVYPIAEEDIEAYIDLTKHDAPGWYRPPVQIRKKGTALEIEPLEISVDPLEISIQLDHKTSKSVPLGMNTRGNVQDGFELVSQSLAPARVTIEGPLQVLDSVAELSTDLIDLEGRNESFSTAARILNPDPLLLIRGNGTAEFQAVIRPRIPGMHIEGIPIAVKGLDPRFEAEPGNGGSVRLEGSRELLDMFIPPPDFLSVDCSALHTPGTYTLPVHIAPPEGLTVVHQEPVELSLTLGLRGNGP